MQNVQLRFSIVIPAYNEEHYIDRTLKAVTALDYPKDAYEVIVVENGSIDATLDVAQKFEGGNVRIVHTDTKGTAHAKNVGIDMLRRETDWVIFLDADTTLEMNFLTELSLFLQKIDGTYSVGTTSILPVPRTLNARIWFALHNFVHRITKSSYSIKMVRRSLFPPIRFDESLTMGEDLHVIEQARRFGKYFFFRTNTVSTSTRRFEKVGWWKIAFMWLFVATLPTRIQRKFVYKVIR
jgi:glycosyltransferase involved in cell wall biosynthesis